MALSSTVLLDIESLRTFVTVLDAGGMTRAAEQLHLTQSAVSWKIKRLETRVGRPLLVRDGRRLRATTDGAELLGYARQIVETHDEAVARLTTSTVAGRLRVGADEDVAPGVIDIVARFQRLHPGTRIDLRVDVCSELTAAVDRGDVDVAVLAVVDDMRRAGDVELHREGLVWVTGAASVENGDTVPLVGSATDCGRHRVARRLLDAAGLAHRDAFVGPSSASAEAAIAAGLGVGLLAARAIEGGRIVPWSRGARLPEPPDIVWVERRATAASGQAVETFGAELRTRFASVV